MVDIPDDDDFEKSGSDVSPVNYTGDLHRDFISALSHDFMSNGHVAIRKLRRGDPGKYLDVITKVIPKEMLVRNVTAMDDRELVDVTRELLGSSAAKKVAQKLGIPETMVVDVKSLDCEIRDAEVEYED